VRDQELRYRLALLQVNGIGPVRYKRLIECLGSAQNVFEASVRDIAHISGLGVPLAKQLSAFCDYDIVDKEMAFVEDHGIEILCFDAPNYPIKLRQCYDAPSVLYYKGTSIAKKERVISIVGTRRNTDYGRQICEELIEGLAPFKPLIVSGLAYGIDIIAHKAALAHSLETVAVLPNGLDTIYPNLHKKTALQMLESGGLLSEYESGIKSEREHFPTRNRIVAGMSDAVIVIESGSKGGSMITAELAFSYNRELFCVPGKLTDKFSQGCHDLISDLKAQLYRGPDDIINSLNWSSDGNKIPRQTELFSKLSEDEQKIYDLLLASKHIHVDEIILKSLLPSAKVSSILFSFEMQGIIRSLPGKLYRLS